MPPDRSRLPPLALNAWLRWDAVDRLIGGRVSLGSVVEVGCGQGGFGVRLAARASSYHAFEPDDASYAVAAARLARLESASVENAPLPNAPRYQVDLLCAFEVLEHLEHDRAAVKAWAGWLRPGGEMLISVPAHPDRFGAWDVAVGHIRRYGREDLSALLASAGLEVVEIAAYGFPLGYVLEWVRNSVAPKAEETPDQRTSKSGRLLQPGPWMAGMTNVATWPFRSLQRPFRGSGLGTGWVALAHSPA